MADLSEQVALVTGASRGVGQGVALGLANAGATVFATGRSIKQAGFGAKITTIACNHTDDKAVTAVFRQINETAGRLPRAKGRSFGSLRRCWSRREGRRPAAGLGEETLKLGRGAEAAAEFQKILDHRGYAPLSPLYPLAHPGLARAASLAGDEARSRKAWEDFFAAWEGG
jgi:NAD(P)-dependent dehydrogenase (short-subunit alcohol dehydrogenase family)